MENCPLYLALDVWFFSTQFVVE